MLKTFFVLRFALTKYAVELVTPSAVSSILPFKAQTASISELPLKHSAMLAMILLLNSMLQVHVKLMILKEHSAHQQSTIRMSHAQMITLLSAVTLDRSIYYAWEVHV